MSRPDRAPGRPHIFATTADFDGSETDDLVRAVGTLVGACASERALARLAAELAGHVERRDAAVVMDQLAWRLERLRALHARAVAEAGR